MELEPAREIVVKSAEDTLLRKLLWYRDGGGVSERQWADVLGIVRTCGERLDTEYLEDWAANVGVSELLDRALDA